MDPSEPPAGSGSVPCSECGFRCESNALLQLHCCYNHYFELVFACKFCRETFREKVDVAEHILE